MVNPEDEKIIPLVEGEPTLFSKAVQGAKNILTGKEEPEVINEVITAKTELEKALAENKDILLKEDSEPEKSIDVSSIKEKMQDLAEKAEELEEKLDTFVDEASKNKDVQKEAVIDVESLREVSQEVKDVAKETVQELENKNPT